MQRWKPNVTVATLVEHQGRFLMVHEQTDHGARYNQPAGHLEPGETLVDAAVRETLEESGWRVEPIALVGIYQAQATHGDITYLRFAFACRAIEHDPTRALDAGIIEALWLSPAEIAALAPLHRGPSVARCLDDYLSGQRYPLNLIHLL